MLRVDSSKEHRRESIHIHVPSGGVLAYGYVTSSISGHLHGFRVIDVKNSTCVIRCRRYGVLPKYCSLGPQYCRTGTSIYIYEAQEAEKDLN